MPFVSNRRCSDPNLYSLKATNFNDNHNVNNTSNNNNNSRIYLPPLLATANKSFFEKQQQFSDTSCQERSIMIDKLIDCSADIIDSIWSNNRSAKIMSTACFIREILKRSRATYSMLQLALFYIFRIKKLIFEHLQQQQSSANTKNELVCCGRRMFLAALMVSSKYLNDKNYRNKTWAKIASLQVAEINATEMMFLKLIDYQLYVSKPLYDKWVSLLHDHIQKKSFIAIAKQKQQDLNYYYSTLTNIQHRPYHQQHHHHPSHYHSHYRYTSSPSSSSSCTSSPSTSVTSASTSSSTSPPPSLSASSSSTTITCTDSTTNSTINSTTNTNTITAAAENTVDVVAPATTDMQQTPPLVFGRKRAHFHNQDDKDGNNNRIAKQMRHD